MGVDGVVGVGPERGVEDGPCGGVEQPGAVVRFAQVRGRRARALLPLQLQVLLHLGDRGQGAARAADRCAPQALLGEAVRGLPAAAPLGADLLEQLGLAAVVVRVVLGEPVVAAAGLAQAQFESARGDHAQVPGQGVLGVLGADVDEQHFGAPQVGVELLELLLRHVLGAVARADAPADLDQPVREQRPGQRITGAALCGPLEEAFRAGGLRDGPAGEGAVVLVGERGESGGGGVPVLAPHGVAQCGQGGDAVGGFENGPTGRWERGRGRII
ncbi:hypothetical protein [Streptomyces sp. NPDC059979]|uniref:hypothetical protein n=1 Tax=Streptomyces sp. NPDC059979 TaxID=3347021 RepID=UPI00368E2D5F